MKQMAFHNVVAVTSQLRCFTHFTVLCSPVRRSSEVDLIIIEFAEGNAAFCFRMGDIFPSLKGVFSYKNFVHAIAGATVSNVPAGHQSFIQC